MDEPVIDGQRAREILDRNFPRKKRFVSTNYKTKNFNIIGFSYQEEVEHKTCPLDVGRRLIKTMKGWTCPECGYVYRKEEVSSEQAIESQYKKQGQTRIVSGKTQKKYYDQFGNLVTDETLLQDIQQGANVISYHEELPADSNQQAFKRKIRK